MLSCATYFPKFVLTNLRRNKFNYYQNKSKNLKSWHSHIMKELEEILTKTLSIAPYALQINVQKNTTFYEVDIGALCNCTRNKYNDMFCQNENKKSPQSF